MKNPKVSEWLKDDNGTLKQGASCLDCRIFATTAIDRGVREADHDVLKAFSTRQMLKTPCRCEPIVEWKDWPIGARICAACERLVTQCVCEVPGETRVVQFIDRDTGYQTSLSTVQERAA